MTMMTSSVGGTSTPAIRRMTVNSGKGNIANNLS